MIYRHTIHIYCVVLKELMFLKKKIFRSIVVIVIIIIVIIVAPNTNIRNETLYLNEKCKQKQTCKFK